MKKLICIIFLLFLFGCIKEETFEFPIVQTGDVIDITSSGAIFHGKIINNGSEPILDYGFVWDTVPAPTIESNYFVKSFLAEQPTNIFSTKVNSSLLKGQIYYVRAYATNNTYTVYGRAVSFKSLGSKTPLIADFNPKVATWGDTVIVEGENFSWNKKENRAYIGKSVSEIIEVKEKQLMMIVPEALDTTNININLSYLHYIITSQEKFNLIPPIISGFSPTSGTYGDTITISGEHFRIDKTQVYFNNIEAKITSINNTQIATVIPPGLKDKNVEIKVIVASQKVISNQYFISDVPQIAAINPKNGTWNDIITIEGNNFSKDISLNTVRFDETVAEIVEANQTSLKVMVPANLLTETSKISVEVRTQIGASGEDFTLNQPEIISFDPMLATFRDTVTISGQNFNPMPQNNRAFLGEVEAVVTEAKASELRIIVPDEFQSELGKTKIELKTGNMNTISNNDFEMYLHKITGVKDSINRNESLIIYGDYFNPTASLNTVHVNGIFKEVINASKNSLAVGFPENLHDGENILDIKVQIGGREVNQNESILVFEPWERVMDFGGGLRRYAISFSANGKGYVGGGLDANGYQRDFYEYDVESNSWMRKSDIPFTSAGWVNWSTDTKGYTLEKKHLWAYDPIIGQWNQLKDFPGNPEWGQSYFSIGDKLYLGTGFSDNGKYSEFWEYDISSDTWTIKASFPFATAFGVGFAINNKGYIATGYDNPYIYEYDSDVDIWTKKLSLAGKVDNRLLAIGLSIEGKGYIYFGTYSFGSNITLNDVYEFDPITNTVNRIVDLPTYGRDKAAFFVISNKAYIGIGYFRATFEHYRDFWQFDPSRIKR